MAKLWYSGVKYSNIQLIFQWYTVEKTFTAYTNFSSEHHNELSERSKNAIQKIKTDSYETKGYFLQRYQKLNSINENDEIETFWHQWMITFISIANWQVSLGRWFGIDDQGLMVREINIADNRFLLFFFFYFPFSSSQLAQIIKKCPANVHNIDIMLNERWNNVVYVVCELR